MPKTSLIFIGDIYNSCIYECYEQQRLKKSHRSNPFQIRRLNSVKESSVIKAAEENEVFLYNRKNTFHDNYINIWILGEHKQYLNDKDWIILDFCRKFSKTENIKPLSTFYNLVGYMPRLMVSNYENVIRSSKAKIDFNMIQKGLAFKNEVDALLFESILYNE